MAINFPASPTTGQVFTSDGQSWTWNGTAWAITQPTPPGTGYLLLTGGTITGSLEIDQALQVDGTLGVTGATTFGGAVTLAGPPTAALHPATKAYVDAADTARPTLTEADARYLRLSAGAASALTAFLQIDSTLSFLVLNETDATAGNRRWRVWGADGNLAIGPTSDTNVSSTYLLRLDRTADQLMDVQMIVPAAQQTALPQLHSLVTRGRGDARYLRLTGGEVTGQLRVPAGNATTPGLGIGATDIGFYATATAISATIAGVAAARITAGTDTTDGLDVITRQKGDARYLRLTGGTLTGGLIATGNITGNLLASASGTERLNLNHNGTAGVISTTTGLIALQPNGANKLQVTGGELILWGDDSNAIIRPAVGRLHIRLPGGGNLARFNETLASGIDVVTRELGDDRYALAARQVLGGNGMAAGTGGPLTGNVTLNMGTPGSITPTSTNSVQANSHTHALSEATIRTLIADGNVGAPGTYALAQVIAGGVLTPGQTVAGSQLEYANASGDGAAGALAGTWRCMGRMTGSSAADRVSLVLRIS
jgi:hypothetical protein